MAEMAQVKERRERGSKPTRWHMREMREMRVLCGEAARERERGVRGVRGVKMVRVKERWGGKSRGSAAVAADHSVSVVVEGAVWLWGQRVGWQVKEQVGGGRMWCVGGGRENDGDSGDRRRDVGAESVGKGGKEWEGERVAARAQRAAEDSEGVGTGGKITAGAESGVAAGQRVWGRGWEREERVAARALRERVEVDSACRGRQWGIGGRQRGGSDRWRDGSGDRVVWPQGREGDGG